MKFAKVDLSSLVAICHDQECLGLLLDRGDTLEILEIPAPVAAYEGLRLLDTVLATDAPGFEADFNQLPGVEATLPMQPVQSTMARAVGYDADRSLLQIEFQNGSVYQYEGVEDTTWEELQDTDSPGQFFNRQIKGHYPSRRLNG